MNRRSGALSCVVLIASFVFAGCSGLVSGNVGNPPPPTLAITNVQTASVTTSSSQVAWTTNVPANSSVDYGTTTSYGNSTPVDSTMVTSHQMTLSGLAAGTTYYYQVNSTDSKGYNGHGGSRFKTGGFSLSGTISPTTAGNGATVALSGPASASATADNSGNYTFAGLPNGSYMVTPTHTGYAFTPGNQSATLNGTNVTGVNFTATATPVAPSITTQPASQTVTAGQTASFSVAATGTAPLTYQWQKNSVAITGATSSSYTTSATISSDNGAQFAVVVTNTAGSATSSAAILTVNAAAVAPSITAQPASQTVTAGQTASFSVAATGTAPLAYQWQKNGANITGATSAGYTTPVTTIADTGSTFRVVVTNTAGTVTSSAATLTVNAAPVAPTITTQPASQTVTAGQTASFSVAATGTSPLNYQWQKNSVAITGATSSSYTTPATTSSDNGAQFTVVVTNTAGSVTSSAAILTVNAAPVAPSITTQPASQTVTAGQTASFSVAATGTAPLTYQWQRNSVAITGATSSSYTTPATAGSDNGALFTVMVTNSVGSVTSSAATLTVNAAPVAPSITTQPASQTVTAGQTASFSVAVAGNAPLTYQWQRNSVAITGATSSSYTTPATTSSDNGAQFTVVVTNTAGSVTSTAAILTVNAAPVAPSITTQPASQTVTAGQTASFSVAATGTAPLTYQWQKNSVAISGATSSSYTTPATTSSDNGGLFAVVVTNTAGSVTSSVATLTVNAAQISVVPSSVNFGNVVTGNSNSQTIKLTNSGSASLTLSQAPISGSGFSMIGLTLPLTLNAGQNTSFNVAFAPAGGGNASGSLSLVGNASNSPLAIPLSGTGVAATFLLGANPTSLDFGTVNVGSSSPLTATLTNNGNSNVTISSVTVAGVGFSASGVSAGATLTPNQSVTLNVTAAPTVAGSLIGTVTVASNAANTPAIIALSGIGATTTVINVKNYGATGNGSTDDTGAINNAIGALTSGATLLFPCGTYITTSQLTINTSNVTVDGSSCAVIKNTAGSTANTVIGGSGNGNPNYGSTVSLSATANELATSFTTVSSLGVAPGDYVLLQQGGKDSSTGSGDTGCDPSGCRGEVLKVASASGNTVTVTTALHDTYNPSLNGATAQKILSPLTGMTVKNITFDGNGSDVYGLELAGVAESTVTGVTARNVQGGALLNRGDFNVGWSNITVTGAGSAQCGSAVWFEKQGNLSINGLSVSNENPGASSTGCLNNGAFGFELQASANSNIANLTVDASGAFGRPFKTSAARYNTFNSTTVKNGVQNYNGISLEYYSSHNTFNNCVVTNNGAGTGTGNGNAGINSFGNFNQYNTFNNCTVTGNGNVQVLVNSFDALRLSADSNVTINGGTFTGSNTSEPVVYLEGTNPTVVNATINGPGWWGILMDYNAANGCINKNTFIAGTTLGGAISSSTSSNVGLGNILNGLSSNLAAGTCGPSGVTISVSPTVALLTSGSSQQFTATVTGSTNTAVTWTASAGSISSSGLFSAPTVTVTTIVTVTATSQADTSQAASTTVTVTPAAPPNTFGYAVQGAAVGSTMSNSVLATRYQMGGQSGAVISMSVFIASPISVAPNNQFQVAIYADNNGAPGTLIASSVSLTIVPDAWNTVPISAPVAANTYYWLAYNTNGLAANTNNLRYDVGGATSAWITSEPFGTWPSTYGPAGGTNSSSTSMYATFQ